MLQYVNKMEVLNIIKDLIMGLEQIVTALGDKAELISEVKSIYDSNSDNVKRIGSLETDIHKAVEKRQSIKDLVRTQLGLTDVSEESLSSYANGVDEGLKSENTALQERLIELQDKYDGLGSTHETEISTMILKDTLRGLGIGDRTANDRAFTELTKLVLDGAERDGATFVFKKDGQTVYNDSNRPLNVEDRISQLQDSEYSYLFKPVTGGGGGQGGQKPSVSAGVKDDNARAKDLMQRMGHRSI